MPRPRAVAVPDRRVKALTCALAVAVTLVAVPAAGGPFVLEATITAPAPAADDFFGCAVAAGEARLVAGARFADAGAGDAGRVLLLDRSGSLVAALADPTPAVGAQLGAAVALVGALVVAGAPHADAGGPHAGAVAVFDAGTGAYRRRLTGPAAAAGDLFGFALAAAGGRLLVGAPFHGADGVAAAGGAYLLDPGTGAAVAGFVAPAPAPYDLFGHAVAAVGGLVAVGAPFDDDRGANAGAVHLFDAGGAFLRTLASPRPRAGDFFGTALADAGGLLAVGAPSDDTAAADAGAVHLFDPATGAWVRTLVDPAPAADARFGAAVAGLGAAVVVGAPFADDGAADAGIVHVFDGPTGAWLDTLRNPAPGAGDQFGGALAGAWPAVLVGAWLDDGAAANGGAVHVFRDAGAPTTTTTSTTTTTPPTSAATSTSTTGGTDPIGTSTTASAPTTTAVTATPTTTVVTTTTGPAGGGGSTSTTAPAPACDDGDPCTADVSASGAPCAHPTIAGYAGVRCRLGVLAELLEAAPADALGGPRLARRLRARLAVAARRVTAAERGAASAAAHVRRARRALVRFVALVERAARRGRMLAALAERLRGGAREADGQLALVAP